MYTDLVLAILHHLLVFGLLAALAAEFVLLRPGLAGRDLQLLAQIDGAYGGMALAVIIVGIMRVVFGLKGWEFYVYGVTFWLKMAAFVAVGLLSIPPTLRILVWRRLALNTSGMFIVPESEIRSARAYLRFELAVFALILVFAAMMARGVGY